MTYQKKIAETSGYGFFCKDSWINNHCYCKDAVLHGIFFQKKDILKETELHFFVKPSLLEKVTNLLIIVFGEGAYNVAIRLRFPWEFPIRQQIAYAQNGNNEHFPIFLYATKHRLVFQIRTF